MMKKTKNGSLKEEGTVETKIVSLEEERGSKEELKSPPSLVLLKGPSELIGFYWPLTEEVTTVGRSQRRSDIVIPHLSVSKAHFEAVKEKNEVYIRDLGSTNGAYLNGKRLSPGCMEKAPPNGQIQAGRVTFKFLPLGHVEFSAVRRMLSAIHTDPLTSAANRHALSAKGPEYFRTEKELSLVVFDVDSFKSINDSLGHPAGDYVLQSLSRLVRSLIRDQDMLFRFGGDEFCLFLPSSIDISLQIAERIRKAVESRSFVYKGSRMHVTVSLGAAARSVQDKSWKDLYARADAAFYEAKRSGKNKVTVWTDALKAG